MEVSSNKKLQHLYLRAGFGLSLGEVQKQSSFPLSTNVLNLFKSSEEYTYLSVVNKEEIIRNKRTSLSQTEKKELREKAREYGKNLNTSWLMKMISDKAQLREKMTFFWHGHFACRSNPLFLQELNNTLRSNALGKFKELLMQVSRSPAMLQFLNNQQNRKEHPNENFARELLELFTIGRGFYTEQDIKEAARAFTGWGFNKEAEFGFREVIHDYGIKTFMGKTGNFNGEDIIEIILEQKQTARFLCNKIYKFFINDNIDQNRLEDLADYFYSSDYDIKALMQKIFNSEWFYDKANIGIKIKSPIEFLVNTNRCFNITYEDTAILVYMQRILGQILFFPPNVSGWPGGRNWIDSSTLMFRLKVPSILLNNGVIEMEAKDIAEEMTYAMYNLQVAEKVKQRVKAYVNWENTLASFSKITEQQLVDYLLQPINENNKYIIADFSAENLQRTIIQLVSTPEYQMC